MQEMTSDGKPDFLGTCFGGEGLGLNSWAGRRAPHHGVHARDDVRWSIWEKIPRSTHARLAQQPPSVAFCLAGVPFGDCVARARDNKRTAWFCFQCSHWQVTIFAAQRPCDDARPAPSPCHGQRPFHHRRPGHHIRPTGLPHRRYSTRRAS